jgi:hypothetical protein
LSVASKVVPLTQSSRLRLFSTNAFGLVSNGGKEYVIESTHLNKSWGPPPPHNDWPINSKEVFWNAKLNFESLDFTA